MKVTTFNPLYDIKDRYAVPQPKYLTYEGDCVQSPKWATEGTIALTTNNPLWPVRLIDPTLIVSIDDQEQSNTQNDSGVKTITVDGSKGQKYIVTITSTTKSCTCQGFLFRNKCKHLQLAAS